MGGFYFLTFAGFGAYLPYFPTWLEGRGVKGALMGSVLALLPVMGVVSPPIVGGLADALGVRASLLRIATAACAIGFALVALSTLEPAASTRAMVALFVASGLFALGRSPLMVLSDVLALEMLEGNRHRYGELRLWGSLGFLTAAVAVGALVDPSSLLGLPLLIAALFAFSFVVSFALPKRATPLPSLSLEGLRALFREKGFLLAILVSQASHSAYDACYSLHARDLGVSRARIGVLWAVGVAVEVVLMSKSAALLSRVPARWLLFVGMVGSVGRWIGVAFAQGFVSLLVLQPLHALSFASVWVASVELTSREHRLATARGIASAAMGVGGVIGLVGFGAIYQRGGGTAAFTGAAMVAACGAAVALWGARRPLSRTVG